MAQWIAIALAVIAFMMIHPVNADEVAILDNIIKWSATITVVSVGSYMVNSAVEKACKAKIPNFIQMIDNSDDGNDTSGEG